MHLREHYKLCLKSKILLSKSCVAQNNKSTAKMHPLVSLQLKGGRTDPGWVLAPLPAAALRKWLNICELRCFFSHSDNDSSLKEQFWKFRGGGQGTWGSQVKLLILHSVGESVPVIGNWGNRGIELQGVPAQACNHPGPIFQLCRGSSKSCCGVL